MKLNESSYCHKRIRLLCKQLEILSGMTMTTDLGEEFEQIQLVDRLGYIIIDYQRNACFTLSHNTTDTEWDIIRELLTYLNWLQIGEKTHYIIAKKNVIKM